MAPVLFLSFLRNRNVSYALDIYPEPSTRESKQKEDSSLKKAECNNWFRKLLRGRWDCESIFAAWMLWGPQHQTSEKASSRTRIDPTLGLETIRVEYPLGKRFWANQQYEVGKSVIKRRAV